MSILSRLATTVVLIVCALAIAIPLFGVRCTVDTSTGSVPAAFLVCSARLP